MKMLRALLAGMILTLCATAPASAAQYYGYSPTTGLETLHGTLQSGGTALAVTSSCGTLGTIKAGATAGEVIAGAVTTCTITLTFPSAAQNGSFCYFHDITTPADTITTATETTTGCSSSAATIVASDKIKFFVVLY